MFPATVYKYLFVGLLLFSLSTKGQADLELLNAKPSYLKKAGKKSLKAGDYYSAVVYFEKYLEKKPENLSVLLNLAHSYRLARDYEKSLKKYEEVIKADATFDYTAYYYLAQMQIRQMLYKEATANLGIFKKNYTASDAPEYKKKVKLLLASCDSAESILKLKENLSITHLDTSVNKAHIELSPYYLEDSVLIFSSLRSDTVVYFDANDSAKTNYPARKFYVAKKTNGQWKFQTDFEGPWNQEGSHNGNGCYSLDSTLFFFTRCALNSRGKMICAIYQSKKENEVWGEAVILPETVNEPGFSSSQPTVGLSLKYNAEVLYFVSDRPKSKGGTDIWYSELVPKKNQWKKAKNLGTGINTALDEMTPHYDNENKVLYFSSEGWPGLGGLDVFSAVGELSTWNVPKNLGTPINSSMDELYYVPHQGGNEGVFISNRKGGINLKNETCCDDIYEFKEIKYVNIAIGGITQKILKTATGEDSLVALSNVQLNLFALQDSTNEKILIKQLTSDSQGKYLIKLTKGVNYALEAAHDETLGDNFTFSTENQKTSDTLEKDFALIEVSEKPIVVKNIYYEFDKSDLTPDSKITIDTTLLLILEKNPAIIIEIGSHTDSKGADDYNKTLSQKRAESVVKYLIQKGVAVNRLQAKGYGETLPIAPNENTNGTDNPEGRALNRRTEFKIIGKIKGVSEIIYRK